MKVVLVNGSPHEKGCTYTALEEVAKTYLQTLFHKSCHIDVTLKL